MRSWAEWLDRTVEDASLESHRRGFVKSAGKILQTPLIRRVYKYNEVGQHRTRLDGRAEYLEEEIRETFALAMSDCSTNGAAAKELPLLAGAYRLTGHEEFRERLVEQLREMTTWSPLQRPGWTLFKPGARLPEDGRDGSWLATGSGVRAIGDALEIMPDESIPEDVLNDLHELLEREIEQIVDDWREKRQWFVHTENPRTNQWALPAEGLVRACLINDSENYEEEYQLGFKNLMASLDSHGEHGEFDEGVGYAGMTVWSLTNAARAMALNGDRRAIEHPFLQRFPRWYIHHLQPGGMLVNAFDAGGASRGRQNVLLPILALLAICTRADEALWAVQHYFEEPPERLVGLAVSTLDGVSEENAPALYAHYPRATRINWRSSWADDADGVWVRGGHAKDQHHHHDMGHVNYIAGGTPILIEAGTPNYSNPKMASHYASGAGHNVLQLGADQPEPPEHNSLWQPPPGWQSRDSEAPIHVTDLNPDGGSVGITVESGYDGLKLWERQVVWDTSGLVVEDNVTLVENRQEIVLFRWHLGTETDVDINRHSDTQVELTWPDATLMLEGSAALNVEQKKMLDHTLESKDDRHLHTCIRVLSAEPTNSLKVKTKIRPS